MPNNMRQAQERYDNMLPEEDDGYEEAFSDWCDIRGVTLDDENKDDLEREFEKYLEQFNDYS